MTIDEVIEKGKFNIFESFRYTLSNDLVFLFYLFIVFFVIAIVISFIVLLDEKNSHNFNFKKYAKTSLVLSLFFPTFITTFVLFIFVMSEYDLVAEWKENTVSSYIDSLPEKRVDIEAFDRINEKSSRRFYTKENLENEIFVVDVLFANEKNVGSSYKGEAMIVFDLKEGETPYMTYKYVEKDLRKERIDTEESNFKRGVYKGFYNPIIHTPKNQFFNQ